MKNAHLRFGFAEFEKTQKSMVTRIRLIADQFIGEQQSGQAHLLSVIGSDSDVAAVYAAIQLNESLRVGSPDLPPRPYRFGEHASLHRGTINIPGRRRPVRHLVAISSELQGAEDPRSIILHRDSPDFILRRLATGLGLPLLPTWAMWLSARLQSQKRIRRLAGLNCSPVVVTGTKAEFLDWIGAALKAGEITVLQPFNQ